MLDLIRTEPALIAGLIDAVLVLLLAFGVPIDPNQKVAIDGVVSAALALATGLVIRTQVAPAQKTDSAPVPAPKSN